jgi:hypothetical protein
MKLYALARIGRAGLGNCLLPWARAEIFARRTGAALLAPRWAQPRLGPWLRAEAVKRGYFGYFSSKGYLSGWKKLAVCAIAHRVDEHAAADRLAGRGRPVLVEFSGLGSMFAPLLEHRALVLERLRGITAERFQSAPVGEERNFVAMHVRRGDLTRQGYSKQELGSVAQYTCLSWFASMVSAIRSAPTLRHLPVVVFTDGYPDEVSELTRMPGVRLRAPQPAIADLWALSRARILFASGNSTFSIWGSFLGGMPTLYAPGKLAHRVLACEPGSLELELEEGAAIPDSVIAHAARVNA